MNIFILNWRDPKNPLSGGAEIVTLEHAKGWVKAGHKVTWFTSVFKGCKSLETIDGVTIIRRGNAFGVYLLAPFYVLKNQRDIDVIVDEIHGIPFFTPLYTRKPVVAFIHEIAGDIWDFMFPFPINIIGKFFETLYFKIYKSCLFWTDAPSTINELVHKGIPIDQCIAIPCPISVNDPTIITQNLKMKKAIRPTFLFVSRIVKMKGIEEVIKAFSFISHDFPQAQLRIVGSGEQFYIRKLKMMIDEYGAHDNVVFVGRVSEKEKFKEMSHAHILLHASVKEGWGLVVLEAASVGTPSVVYNVEGLKDVVKNGKTGVVLQYNSPQEMAREAIRLYGDSSKYQLYQKNGKAFADSLKWDDVTKQSLSLLHASMK